MSARRKFFTGLLVMFFAALICGAFFLFYFQFTSSRRPRNRFKGTVSVYTSSTDKDQDGIDDQTDILKGALAYVRKRPEYLSKYYADGYPNDGYGVCTDVIAFALRDAGYDLQQLVNEDILMYPSAYGISEPDSNIDFRRVDNLEIYFSRHAISLTTDISEIEQWQGGDIVTFNNHIGIVSDRRNAQGIPYLIHHSGPMQKKYEEDILSGDKEIVGHYRIS